MSPYLKRLDQEYLLAASNRVRGEISARRACYLARIGEFEKSRSSIAALRSEFGDGNNPRITVLIIIAEALNFHYEKLDASALDRIARAQILSRLIKDVELEAVSSAWRAHFEFDHSKFPETFKSLQDALDSASLENNDARTRISNVVCKLALFCGDSALAKRHFALGREYALKDSDQASVEALQHNKAAFRLSRLRAAMALGNVDPIEVRETRIEISSAKSLQNLTGVLALPSYIELCEARILVVEGRYLEAIDSLERTRNLGPFPVGSLNAAFLDLEILFCRSQIGDLKEPAEALPVDRTLNLSSLDFDEKLMAYWMDYQLCCQNEKYGNALDAKTRYDNARAKYNEFMDFLNKSLTQLRGC